MKTFFFYLRRSFLFPVSLRPIFSTNLGTVVCIFICFALIMIHLLIIRIFLTEEFGVVSSVDVIIRPVN